MKIRVSGYLRIIVLFLFLLPWVGPAAAQESVNLTEEERTWIAEHPILKVGNELDWPPFDFAEEGEAKGYSIDLLQLIGEKTGLQFEFINGFTWTELMEQLKQGELDILPAMADTPERRESTRFTSYYLEYPSVLVVRQNVEHIKNIEDMEGEKIAIVQGYYFEELVRENYPEVEIVLVPGFLEGLTAVFDGEVTAFIGSRAVVMYTIRKYFLSDLRIAGRSGFDTSERSRLHIGVRKDQEILWKILQKGLDAVSEEETRTLTERWIGLVQEEQTPEVSQPSLLESAWRLIAIGAVVFLILSVLIRLFIKVMKEEEVAQRFGSRQFRVYTIVALSLFVTIVSLLAWFVIQRYKRDILADTQAHLEDVLHTTAERLDIWVEQRKIFLKQLGRDPELVAITEDLLAMTPDRYTLASSAALADARNFLNTHQGTFGELGFAIITPEYMSIASERDSNIGIRHLISLHHSDLLERAFRGEVVFVPPVRSDLPLSSENEEHADNKTSPIFFAGPIRKPNGTIIAVLTQRVDPAKDFSRVLQFSRVGETGETYAFDQQGRLLSESRFEEHLREIGLIEEGESSILNIEIRDPGGNMVEGYQSTVPRSEQPLTYMAASAFQLKSHIEQAGSRSARPNIETDVQGYRDYRGVPVFGAWLWKPELGLGLTSEIDVKEALSMYDTMRLTVMGVLGITMFLSVGATLMVLALGERTNKALLKARDELEKRVEERTEELRKLSSAVEQSQVSVVITDPDGTIEYVNPKFSEVTGYSVDEALGQNPRIMNAGVQPPELYQELWKTITAGRVWQGAFANRKKSGDIYWENATISPIRDTKGQITHFVAVKEDITERRRAEEALRESEAKHRTIFQNSPLGMILFNNEGIIVDCNDRFVELMGSSKERLIGFNTLKQAADPAVREGLAKALNGGRADFEGEYTSATGDKTTYLRIIYNPVNPHQPPTEVIATLEDITVRKQAEKALADQLAFIQALVDTIPNPIFVMGPDLRYITFNAAHEKAYGMRREDYIGKTVLELDYTPSEDRARYHAEDVELMKSGGMKHKDAETLYADGKIHSVLQWLTTFELSDGVLGGLLGVQVDISEQKRLERELAKANERMEGELNIGREIQMNMLPLIFPAFPDHNEFAVYANLHPAREVGGDFYDFFFIDEERFCFCIGDVSGKGVPAALFMAVTKTLIKSRSANDFSPASILTHVNDELSQDNKSCMFVTIFAGILNINIGSLIYTNAGHNPPYLKRDTGVLERLAQRHGPVIGAVEGMTYKEDTITLSQGDMLLMYTDGVTEAMDVEDQLFSEKRLVDLLHVREFTSVEDVVHTTMAMVKEFEGEADQADDITILAVEFLGQPGETAAHTLELTIKNNLPEIDQINREFNAFADQYNIPKKVSRKMNLVFDELLNNTISYAYKDQDEHKIEITVELFGDRLIVTIMDDGRPFNPFGAEAPDTELSIEERQIGGLGIHLVRNVMDKVSYQRRVDKNVVFLVKHLKVENKSQKNS